MFRACNNDSQGSDPTTITSWMNLQDPITSLKNHWGLLTSKVARNYKPCWIRQKILP